MSEGIQMLQRKCHPNEYVTRHPNVATQLSRFHQTNFVPQILVQQWRTLLATAYWVSQQKKPIRCHKKNIFFKNRDAKLWSSWKVAQIAAHSIFYTRLLSETAAVTSAARGKTVCVPTQKRCVKTHRRVSPVYIKQIDKKLLRNKGKKTQQYQFKMFTLYLRGPSPPLPFTKLKQF